MENSAQAAARPGSGDKKILGTKLISLSMVGEERVQTTQPPKTESQQRDSDPVYSAVCGFSPCGMLRTHTSAAAIRTTTRKLRHPL
jgi:hypothetical protein